MKISPIFALDGYKFGHRAQYPAGTTLTYGNFTPRTNKYFNSPFFNYRENGSPLVWFGSQAFVLQWLIDEFKENFFGIDKTIAVAQFKNFTDGYLGEGAVAVDGIEKLHDLGYLPLVIKAIPEGDFVNIKTPTVTVMNTLPEFYWLTNYIETLMSAELWPTATAATIAFNYRCIGEYWAAKTCDDTLHMPWQFHDFSLRGDMGMWAGSLIGMGHLTSFQGSDSVFGAVRMAEQYPNEGAPVANSVNATEHSVMCMGGKVEEIETFERLINETYPTGIVSIVSDAWDYWKVISEYLPRLKNQIEARDGKVVIRPDSGNPVDIICGLDYIDLSSSLHLGEVQTRLISAKIKVAKYKGEYYKWTGDSLEQVPEHVVLGSIEMMWRTFGGTVNKKGFKVLNPKIGLIYGDSITMERAEEIFMKLAKKDFASSNIVLGIGSYTYQYVTRDTFGFAMKVTYGVVNGGDREVFKDPATDDGSKKSLKGLIYHYFTPDGWAYKDQATVEEMLDTELEVIYHDGNIPEKTGLQIIRDRVTSIVNIFVKERISHELPVGTAK